MSLNDLSLDELTELSGNLRLLEEVGRAFVQAGMKPSFDLTPGGRTKIMLPGIMPAAPAEDASSAVTETDQSRTWRDDPASDEAWCAGNQFVLDRLCKFFGLDPNAVDWDGSDGSLVEEADALLARIIYANDDTPSPEAAQPQPALAPEETPLAAGDTAGGAPIPSATEQSAPGLPEPTPPAASEPQDDPQPVAAVAEGSGGGEAVAAAGSPAAPAAVPGAAHQDRLLPASWTEEEDADLVRLVAFGIAKMGLTKGAAIRAAAKGIGRPEQGSAFRLHHKLKPRLDAALTEAAMGQAQTEIPEDKPFPVQEGAAGEGATPPAAQPPAPVSFAADEVTSHLMALPDKGGWTVDRDLELMELSIAGWQPNEIALQLQVQANLVKPRFDALTGLYDDATGKKVRRFTREAVFAALSRLAGKAA